MQNNDLLSDKNNQTKDIKARMSLTTVYSEALRYIQGTTYYFILLDTAAGLFVKESGSYEKITNQLRTYGYSESILEISWDCYVDYSAKLPDQINRMTVFNLVSAWDRFIRKIVEYFQFVEFTNSYSFTSKTEERDFNRFGYLSVKKQMEFLEKITKGGINIPIQDIVSLNELNLARNLGLHNQWEQDGEYVMNSTYEKREIGKIRMVSPEEITEWHRCLINAFQAISSTIAQKFPLT